jgi:hypothetical protein
VTLLAIAALVLAAAVFFGCSRIANAIDQLTITYKEDLDHEVN